MRFTAAGDALIQQRIPETYEGFERIRAFIERGEGEAAAVADTQVAKFDVPVLFRRFVTHSQFELLVGFPAAVEQRHAGGGFARTDDPTGVGGGPKREDG